MESRVAILLLAVLPMVLAVPYLDDRVNALGDYPDSARIQRTADFPNDNEYQSEVGLPIAWKIVPKKEKKVEYVFTETGPFHYNIMNTISSVSLPCSADYYFNNRRMFVRMTLAGVFHVKEVEVRVVGHNDGQIESFMSPNVLLKDSQSGQIKYSQMGVDQESGENVRIAVQPTMYATVIEAQIWKRGYGCPLNITFSFTS